MASPATHLLLIAGVGPRPIDDPARAHDGLGLVEDQDRQGDLAGHLLDLPPAAAPLAPGPGDESVARQIPNLILVPGIVERLRRATASVTERGEGLLLAAGVEDHGARLSSRAITSGTCSR